MRIEAISGRNLFGFKERRQSKASDNDDLAQTDGFPDTQVFQLADKEL